MDLLMICNRFHHEVRPVADIGVCAEKNRSYADGQDEIVETCIAEQKSDLDFFDANSAAGQVGRMVFLERCKRVANRFCVRTGYAGKIDVVVHQLLNLVDDRLIDKQSESGA